MTQRPIKFRAWYTPENHAQPEMFYNACSGFDGEVSARDILGTPITIPMDEAVLTQFTGLHDKNGKEIWEGDRVSVGGQEYVINWYAMAAGWWLFTTSPTIETDRITSAGVPMRDWNWLDSGKGVYWQDVKKSEPVEVIGNIYENPELLK